MSSKATISWSVGVIASIAAIGTTAGQWWPSVGWQSPNAHASDVAEIQADLRALEAETLGGVQEFRDEWKCDEYDEELRDMLRRQAAGDDSTDLAEDIRRLREKMRELDCGRFEDYG